MLHARKVQSSGAQTLISIASSKSGKENKGNMKSFLLRKTFHISRGICLVSTIMVIASDKVYSQTKTDPTTLTLLQVLPLITFIIALATGVLNLYVMNRLGRSKEEILAIVRSEFKSEIHELENRMAVRESEGRELNKERISALKESLEGRLSSIFDKVNKL